MTDQDMDSFLGRTPRTRRQRLIRWGGIAVAVLLILFIVSRMLAPRPQSAFATAQVTRGDLDVTVSATGNLAPTKQVNVGSEESGLVEKVYVANNDKVRQGQPLASLDLSRLRDSLVQSQASLEAALATVQQNEATVSQTKANLARYEEVSRLSAGRVPSRTEFDTARADYARAVANVAAARAQVAQARAEVSTNQTNLAKGTIYAPVNGVVLSRQVEPGQTVAAQFNVATLFTIAEDLSRMKLEVKVDEADIGELHEGAAASFTVDAYPGRVFGATVTRVDLGANATPQVNSAGTTVSSTSTVVAYTAVLSVANPDLLLKPGMTATATIHTAHRSGVLLVPNAALRFSPAPADVKGGSGLLPGPPDRDKKVKTANIGRGGQQQLWVQGADGTLSALQVTVGDTDGTNTEVTGKGLRSGMRVVTGKLAAAAQ
ncbi:efflux RND transporter periplasmic adaptor subunit [Flavisphingomonas formosensis]|uniref:efflux RND transporter periplasmic adaptor subunit n=1 Tax=Flavisphingomonas formosensis TaxID=861534 RepID=UPI0012FB083C|nr:efflux RND transporter periplasmic adaptor subunit [Sphingomonas formosensis]